MPGQPITDALLQVKRAGIAWVRRYHRLSITGPLPDLDGSVMFVANHGFGGIFDLNVFVAYAIFEDLGIERPVIALTHQLAWTLQVGRFLEPLGARPASESAAREAVASGGHVLVLPGGDLDAGKSFTDRNKIVFGGRRGFARMAMDLDIPIVPIVTTGAGETLLVLSDGHRLAQALRLDKLMRTKAVPTSLSVPWGLNIGIVGLIPYFPLPAKLTSRVLSPMRPIDGEGFTKYGDRVESAMQSALDELTGHS